MSITQTISEFGEFLKAIATYVKEIYEAIMKYMNKE